MLTNSAVLSAQKVVESSNQSAGFSFTADSGVAEPIIQYQQNVQMLASMPDKPTLRVYGDGRVLVHYPAYMKKAGDYEMSLDVAELQNLIQAFSANGIMDFDEKKVKGKLDAQKKALRENGQFYVISDADVTVVDIRLDEYQKNSKSEKIGSFHKQFKWKNIEHDATRYKSNTDIIKANSSVLQLKELMNDTRLVKRQRQ